MDQKSQILSLRDAASQINSVGDLQTVLQHLIDAACRHAHWALGSIMGIDAAHGDAYVIVRYDPTLIDRQLPEKWQLATSPSLIALQRNEPVYIRDARESDEFPGYRKEAFERDYRTVLVIPMNCNDAEGRPMVLSVISRQVTEVSDADLAFLGAIIHMGAIAVEREHRLDAEKRAAQRLERALNAHTSLLDHVLRDGSVAPLSAMVDKMLPNPTVVVDFTANQVISGRPPNGMYTEDTWQDVVLGSLAKPLMKAARDAVERGTTDAATLFLDDGAQRFRITTRIEALLVDNQLVGALIIFPTSREFSDLDLLMLDSAKFALSVQMMRSFIRFRFETRTQTELLFEIVEGRWRNVADVAQRAQRLGLNFSIPQQMIVIDFPEKTKALGGASVDVEHTLSRIMLKAALPVNLIATDGGVVCLVQYDTSTRQERTTKLTRRISEELGRYFDEAPIVVVSNRCAGLSDYPAAWERCRRMIIIGRSFGLTGAISAQDFGPLPMLVAASEVGDVRSFVEASVGTIATHDRENGTPYLETLATYLQESCRSQACADSLGLHVTTLRYRLSRIQELFGIDVETPDKRFAVELAIRLHSVIDNQTAAK
ncbi:MULTISPECIES: helix-turn-helix domain-containing protein [Agrobacterium]|uniref:GAF domain-containing protein n=1 Tax=Agrobacterium rubi TaxID=28099 RepID=A0AAE7UT50_9HYPH|nr:MULTISPECIES: helix-turn-helix domain-containing protein [Agrobacterium]MBN7807795.1 helix-turn-helix domain-containing protein [Agrobacterium rosae]NTE89754.1 GAF domain-containing protein [Agrobacterium rubi]NTF05396.1 GAF domain-containing protein [Agrobacterium rubi]NTF39840.1 GAF domain-containing protein [Agrobacterium rubi]OCJ44856.1 PucR family transcriptional regulator [Agrobacterium rubi]